MEHFYLGYQNWLGLCDKVQTFEDVQGVKDIHADILAIHQAIGEGEEVQP